MENMDIDEFKRVLNDLSKNPKLALNLPSYFLFNKKYVLSAVKKNSEVYKFLPEDIRLDKRISFEALKNNNDNFQYFPNELKFIIDKNSPLKSLSSILITNHDFNDLLLDSEKKEYLLENIKSNPELAKLAPNIIVEDERFAMELVKVNGKAFRFFPEELRGNKEIALVALSNSGECVSFLNETLASNRELLLTAVKSNPETFRFIPKTFKDNKSFTIAALRQNPLALEFINEDFKNDLSVTKTAINKDPTSLIFASNMLKNDDDLVKKCLIANGNTLEYFSEKYRGNLEYVNLAYKSNPSSYKFATEDIKSKKENTYWRVIENPSLVFTIPIELLSDSQFINEVTQSAVSKNLFDQHFKMSLLQIVPQLVVDNVSSYGQNKPQEKILNKSKSVSDIIPLLKSNPEIILTLDKGLISNEEVQKRLIETNPKTIFFMGESALQNKNLVTLAYNKSLDNELDATIFRETLISSVDPQMKKYCENNTKIEENKNEYILSDKFAASQSAKSKMLNDFRNKILGKSKDIAKDKTKVNTGSTAIDNIINI